MGIRAHGRRAYTRTIVSHLRLFIMTNVRKEDIYQSASIILSGIIANQDASIGSTSIKEYVDRALNAAIRLAILVPDTNEEMNAYIDRNFKR